MFHHLDQNQLSLDNIRLYKITNLHQKLYCINIINRLPANIYLPKLKFPFEVIFSNVSILSCAVAYKVNLYRPRIKIYCSSEPISGYICIPASVNNYAFSQGPYQYYQFLPQIVQIIKLVIEILKLCKLLFSCNSPLICYFFTTYIYMRKKRGKWLIIFLKRKVRLKWTLEYL